MYFIQCPQTTSYSHCLNLYINVTALVLILNYMSGFLFVFFFVFFFTFCAGSLIGVIFHQDGQVVRLSIE